MATLDDIDRLLRDHTGYTGDGQGGHGALPVGDRSTARHKPLMRDYRAILKAILQAMGNPEALDEILAKVDGKADLANSGRVFTSRTAAVNAGQENLPGTLGLIFTIEGSNNETLAVRSFSNASDDPLFASQPRWGVAMRVPNVEQVLAEIGNGRIWHTTSDNLATQTPPEGTDQISMATNAGQITYRRLTSAPVPVDPAIHKQTADGIWWRLSEDTAAIKAAAAAETAARMAVDNRTGWLPVAVTADADEWSASPDAALTAQGMTVSADSVLLLTVPRSNTGPVHLTVAGDSYGRRQVLSEDGAALTGGELIAGRRVALIRTHPYLRIWTGGVAWADLRAERTARIASVVNAGTVALEAVAGSGDAITAEVPQILRDHGISATNLRRISFIPIAANTGTVAPTVNINGMGDVPIYTAANAVPPAGALSAGRIAEAVKVGARWRLVSPEVRRVEMDSLAETTGRLMDERPFVGDEHVLAVDAAGNVVAYFDTMGRLALGGLDVDWSRVDLSTLDWSRMVTDDHHTGDPYILLADAAGNALIWVDEAGNFGGGGSGGGVSRPVPATAGNAWQLIDDGTSIRYLSDQYQGRVMGFEERGGRVLAETGRVATGILAFGGGSSLVDRTMPEDWRYHLRDPDLSQSSGMLAAEAQAVAMLTDNHARHLALPTVIGLTAGIGSPVEADTARESALYQDALTRIATAVTNLPAWDKTLVIDRVLLSLLGGAPDTSQIAADNIYAATAANLRADIVGATGQGLPPLVVVSPSAGTREGGSGAVALAEAKLDSTHPALGFVVACPRHACEIETGTLATLTPQSAALLSEMEAIAVREVHGGGLWYCPRLVSATRSGTTITASFVAMSGLSLPAGGDHGLSLSGASNGVTITNVALSGKVATITLSGVPSGTLSLNCAWGREGTPADARPINRSDIRDGWSEPSRIRPGYIHHRLALPASVPVTT